MTKAAFVLASVMGQAMIVNRYDYDPDRCEAGIGASLLEVGQAKPALAVLIAKLAAAKRAIHGDGVVIIDGGANIGTFSVLLGKFMEGWGRVIAFEPQRWPYYALCGNLAINNCFNVEARQQALGNSLYRIAVPAFDPDKARNFGGTSLNNDGHRQEADGTDMVNCSMIDAWVMPRLDILKLDIEGMEIDALEGAQRTIAEHKPIIIAEAFICGPENIVKALPDYEILGIGPDVLCIHRDEPNEELRKAVRDLARQLNLMADADALRQARS